MNILQLTSSADGLSIYVFAEHLTMMKWDGDTKTTELWFSDGSSMEVAERPEEIMRLINPLTN